MGVRGVRGKGGVCRMGCSGNGRGWEKSKESDPISLCKLKSESGGRARGALI